MEAKSPISGVFLPKALRCLAVSFFFILLPLLSRAKTSNDSIFYSVETRASFAGGENTPFWLVSNLHGLGSPEFNNGFVRGRIGKNLDSSKKFSWGATADLTAGWHLPGAFRIQQLFAEIKYRALGVSFGAREIKALHNNPHLSTGDLLFSGNALPIPQLRVGTYGYAPFWGTKGWFSVNIYLAYGMFTDSHWQKNWIATNSNHTSNVLFCGRALSLKFGNPKVYPLTLDVGIEMGTQFGGTVYWDKRVIKMPTGLIDWLKAIIPLSGSDKTPDEEQTNVQGNMNGEYSIGLNWTPAPGWNIRGYWEHYFEDHSQLTFEYGLWKDGLYGVELTFPKNRFLSKLVFENISTKDQTGAVNHDYTPEIPEQIRGGDNYFNHYLYDAWQTWGMSIGTPLAISPLYNRIHKIYIYNTRFIVQHLGLEGNPCDNLNWRCLLTYSRNWGTYRYPFKDILSNFSGLLEISYSPDFLRGFGIKGALAIDHGKLLGNNFGGMISLAYRGNFSLHSSSKK